MKFAHLCQSLHIWSVAMSLTYKNVCPCYSRSRVHIYQTWSTVFLCTVSWTVWTAGNEAYTHTLHYFALNCTYHTRQDFHFHFASELRIPIHLNELIVVFLALVTAGLISNPLNPTSIVSITTSMNPLMNICRTVMTSWASASLVGQNRAKDTDLVPRLCAKRLWFSE